MPSGLYIHIPFCTKKCNYCDFYLVTNLNIIDNFLHNLSREMELQGDRYKGAFDTVFLGGGTPSLLTEKQFETLFRSLHKNFNIDNTAEITIESNPEDFINNPGKFGELKKFGINRLSLGVQSFNNDELKFLTREHYSEEAIDVIRKAKEYFDNLSIDIIYSIPGQTKFKIENTLKDICELKIPHVSAYTLIFEKETRLYHTYMRGDVNPLSEKTEAVLYDYVTSFLKDNGYTHYEVSNYARPGYESRHNKKYWNYESYLGLGPSSHSFADGKRWNNIRNIVKYNLKLKENLLPVEEVHQLTDKEKECEFLMLALRSSGVNFERYKNIFGRDFLKTFAEPVAELSSSGLAELDEDKLRLTENGYKICDEICARYF